MVGLVPLTSTCVALMPTERVPELAVAIPFDKGLTVEIIALA
jgi:hypothetical protein